MARRPFLARFGAATLVVSAGIYVACSSFDAQDTPQEDAQAPDAAEPDRAPGVEAAAPPADAAPPDIQLAENWSTFNLGKVVAAGGFSGGVFDGRHVYLVPTTGRALRFDATLAFNQATSWSAFDLRPMIGDGGLLGGTFDGRYVYYAPNAFVADGTSTRAARLDTQGEFGDAGSWQAFVVGSIFDAGAGLSSGTYFDGEKVVFTPYSQTLDAGPDAAAVYGRAVYAQHRPGASFADAAAWSGVEGSKLVAPIKTFGGAGVAYDGTYAYSPEALGTKLARVKLPDTGEIFDLAKLTAPDALGYGGAVFDGRYVYLPPLFRVGASLGVNGVAVRYDTSKTFGDVSSYQKLDLASVHPQAKGFNGGVFDGRFVYFAPVYAPVVMRFDTTRAFIDGTAWTFFDVSSIAPNQYFTGAVFDGQYVYFVPSSGSIVVRFKARNDRIQPPRPASFY